MRKLLLILLLCMAALALLCCMPITDSLAESAAPANAQTLLLNDGAPIPYLDGYESELVKDVDALRGVTGAADIQWTDHSWSDGPWMFHIHNVAVTDDVIAFFYTQRSDTPIPLANDGQVGWSWAARSFLPFVDGKGLNTVSEFHEAHPVDANTLYCLAVWSLEEPLGDGRALSVGDANDRADGLAERYDLLIDRSQASDPTVAYAPMTQYDKKRVPFKDTNEVRHYRFVVERVAFTPFGNRCLINYHSTSERNAFMNYRLTDGQGNVLMQTSATNTYSTVVSAEHPEWRRNENWFLGGEGSAKLTLVPTGGDWLSIYDVGRTVVAPLDALPAQFALEDGSALRIESVDLSRDGFTVWYTLQGYAERLWFAPADENGVPLDIPLDRSNTFSNLRGMLKQSAYWTNDYKGEIVSKAPAGELARFGSIQITYTTSADHWLMPEDAAEIQLQ